MAIIVNKYPVGVQTVLPQVALWGRGFCARDVSAAQEHVPQNDHFSLCKQKKTLVLLVADLRVIVFVFPDSQKDDDHQ